MKKQQFHKLEEKARIYNDIVRFHIFNDYAVRPIAEMANLIDKHRGVIENYIYFLRKATKRIYKEWGSEHKYEPDNRTGEKTYGYKSIEEIEGNLDYISDRFACEFRLRWMLGIPNKIGPELLLRSIKRD